MDAETKVDLSPEPGWSEFPAAQGMGGPRSFVSGDPHGDRLRAQYYRRDADNAWVGKVWFGPGAEGPPDHAHGGSTAAVLDEAMGGSVWMTGHLAVAAQITLRYRNMLPLGMVAIVEAKIDRVEGRKVHARGNIQGPDGQLFCEAEGIFIKLDEQQLGELAGRYPDTIKLFESISSTKLS
jgi:acyl-coenzyme A thioesterase PaaI-like protein